MPEHPPLADLSDSDLEQRLIDLGPRLYPTTPDLATQVRHPLESEHSLTPLPSSPVEDSRGGTKQLPSPLGAGRRAGDEGVFRAGDRLLHATLQRAKSQPGNMTG